MPRERLAWGQQVRHRKGRKITDPVYAKRGRYDPDDEGQDDSAAPSEVGDDERGTFAVPQGRAPRAKKQPTPLGAPGVATGSVTSREADDQWRSRSRSRNGTEDERMDVDEPRGSHDYRMHQPRRSR